MKDRRLKIAAIGLSEKALTILDIASECGLYEIIAVSDERGDRAEMIGRKFECEVFTDHRQLIVQTEADFLFFGGPAHESIEFMRLGLQEGFHVLKTVPPTLNFSQLTELYRLAKKNDQFFLTIQNGRFRESFSYIRSCLDRLERHQGQSWHLISAVCHVPKGEMKPELRWLSDPNMAGGGVLMHDCYDLIDELLLCFGLPQKVYALTVNQAPDRQQRMSLTEDTAIVTMQFTDALIAQICASRTLGPARRHLRVHGQQQHLTATEEEVVVCDNTGELIEQKTYADDDLPSLRRTMENLAKGILEPDKTPFYPFVGFDINTMAVIEAVYLSTRTGMAEEPGRILQLADIDPAGLFQG